ncbi:DUF485 domain-containing protein [Roseomonas populi]|uniref:DUF485 domain-containing protein n=1 Tax=Roseomonas populi TaxID=3121582 RepID=A0ABT1XCA2_9PROT|nr:DUF485 domain-containing protein [Roseomonas pecuniae]MCR0985038.1 DUF485 domain-containing protein [Roseomonas pecuniae]
MSELERLRAHPAFRQLARQRAMLGWGLAGTMTATYFAFILCVAFRPGLLGAPIAAGWTTSYGVVAGVGVIALGFVLTAAYVLLANARFDALGRLLREEGA